MNKNAPNAPKKPIFIAVPAPSVIRCLEDALGYCVVVIPATLSVVIALSLIGVARVRPASTWPGAQRFPCLG
jgi:hypothetical protein